MKEQGRGRKERLRKEANPSTMLCMVPLPLQGRLYGEIPIAGRCEADRIELCEGISAAEGGIYGEV